MKEIEIRKTYYPNGQIESEWSFKNGIPHGICRRWHENGVLALEWILKDGVFDSVGKQWDEDGNSIVSFEIINGNGVSMIWEETQQFFVENTLHEGRMTGRTRIYLKDGTIINEGYQFQGKTISKKKYIEECKKDPTLPRYDINKAERKPIAAKTPPLADNDEICKEIISSAKAKEAKAWFKSGKCFLGEGKDEKGSRELIEILYKAGSVKVWVFEINIDESGEQYSGRIIIELPKNTDTRRKIFSICDEIAKNLGFDREKDRGQQYRLLMLD